MTNLPYTRHTITPADAESVVRLLGSGAPLTQGPMVEAFEAALCALTSAPYAVVVNSGTAALHLAYGILYKPGQTITMPAISFVATANAALYCGLAPSFVDVSPRTGLVMGDCDVGVELGGQPTGHRHTIVDACHSLRYVESALVTILSFHPAKHICCGEGGAILTGNPTIAERARLLRSHGRIGTSMEQLGFNYRMPDLNAALGVSQSAYAKTRITQRQELSARYDALLGSEAENWGTNCEVVPHSPDSHRHLYQIRVKDRARVQSRLKERGIGTAIHYPNISRQPYYVRRFGEAEGLCWADDYASQTLSLPLYPGLTEGDQQRVAQVVKEAV